MCSEQQVASSRKRVVKLLIWLPLSLAAACYALPATEPKPLGLLMFQRLSPSLVALSLQVLYR